MVDLPNEAEIVALFVHRPGARYIVASDAGDGFVVVGTMRWPRPAPARCC